MDKWIYRQTITTLTGSQLDEIECPRCGYRQTVSFQFRPSSCYVCETELDPDDVFLNQIRDFILKGLEINGKAEELC